MKKIQIGALSGILFPILLLLFVGIATFYAGNDTTAQATYVANMSEHTRAIMFSTGMGLLSVVLLLMHLEWLTGVVSKHAPFAAKIARSCGQIAAIGIAFTYGLILLATYGLEQANWPDQMVHTTGMLGSTIGSVFYTGFGAFAGVIAYLGWKGIFPKWIAALATLEVVIAVVATGVGAPGAAFMPTTAWLLINAVGMLFYERKSS